MDPYLKYLNSLIAKNKKEFAGLTPEPGYISYSKTYEAGDYRSELIKKLEGKSQWLFQKTKPFLNDISKGCMLCGQGEWSCLFITGLCNANCFYCPASQHEDHLPTTQSLEFNNPDEYIEYLKRFRFKGMSVSGGEPFLFFDRTLDYIQTAKKALGNDLYIWMYTNGIAGDKEKFSKLAETGLTEVRFDIGATGYSTEYIKNAAGIVPVITVEIPAVSDEIDNIKKALPELVELGVKHLNFHQIRLTRHNYNKVLKRNFTFLHGERVTVLESEITALEIMNYVAENSISIGVNYCAFQYKSRFQKAGYRKKVSNEFKIPGETVTQNGFIRRILLDKKPEAGLLLKESGQLGWYELEGYYLIELQLLKQLKDKLTLVIVEYWGVSLEKDKEIIPIRARSCQPLVIRKESLDDFIKLVEEAPVLPPSDPFLFESWRMEYIESEWRGYY